MTEWYNQTKSAPQRFVGACSSWAPSPREEPIDPTPPAAGTPSPRRCHRYTTTVFPYCREASRPFAGFRTAPTARSQRPCCSFSTTPPPDALTRYLEHADSSATKHRRSTEEAQRCLIQPPCQLLETHASGSNTATRLAPCVGQWPWTQDRGSSTVDAHVRWNLKGQKHHSIGQVCPDAVQLQTPSSAHPDREERLTWFCECLHVNGGEQREPQMKPRVDGKQAREARRLLGR